MSPGSNPTGGEFSPHLHGLGERRARKLCWTRQRFTYAGSAPRAAINVVVSELAGLNSRSVARTRYPPAVRYNRKLRTRRTLRSDLGDIPGIGPQRQTTLLKRFGSVQGVREATKDEIARVPGFSEALASRVLTYLGR